MTDDTFPRGFSSWCVRCRKTTTADARSGIARRTAGTGIVQLHCDFEPLRSCIYFPLELCGTAHQLLGKCAHQQLHRDGLQKAKWVEVVSTIVGKRDVSQPQCGKCLQFQAFSSSFKKGGNHSHKDWWIFRKFWRCSVTRHWVFAFQKTQNFASCTGMKPIPARVQSNATVSERQLLFLLFPQE